MFTKFFPSLFLIGTIFLITSCDTTESPSNTFFNSPIVESLTIEPNLITFLPEDGFKDTTIQVMVKSSIQNLNEETEFGYVVIDKSNQESVYNGELSIIAASDSLIATIPIALTTTSFKNYLIEVYAYDKAGNGNYIHTSLSVTGISTSKPVITNTTSPGTITRPETGAIPAVFTATVTDEDGDETITGVFIRVIQNGNDVQGSPFSMSDDGSTLGDTTSNDLTFTWSQDITPAATNPDRDFNIEFYALDVSGLSSDTVRTTFQIRGN